jgi:hypothetical protein
MVAFSAEMRHVNGVSAAITLNDDVNANKSAMSLFMVSAVGLILGRTLKRWHRWGGTAHRKKGGGWN